jgi:hypothetical protein
MMIFILAAGDAERWGGECKQLKEVRGETVLGRTVRMLPLQPISIVTHRDEIMGTKKGYSGIVPFNHDTLLSTVLSTGHQWYNYDEVLFLMGDVVWTRAALDKVLADTDKSCQFYGSLDEHFAFRFKREMYDQGQLQARIKEILDQGRQGTTWELYRSICGIPLGHRLSGRLPKENRVRLL